VRPADSTISRPRARVVLDLLTVTLVVVLAVTGCGVTRADEGGENRRLRMMIPNSPGGGYDQTGRAAVRVMETEDQEALLVPPDSPFQTVEDLVEAWRADPGSVRVGGGSAPAGGEAPGGVRQGRHRGRRRPGGREQRLGSGHARPLLAIGLPTTAAAAVILAAMQSYGLQPGPQLFEAEPELVWTLLASLFVANTLLLVINLPMAPLWARLLRIPRPYLYAGILFFAVLGAYSVNFQWFDVALLGLFGTLGFAMRRFALPVLPLIVGVILGPRLEEQLGQALQLSQGDVSALWSEPVAVIVYVVIAALLLAPLVLRLIPGRQGPERLEDAVDALEEEVRS
jgi:hypothetical protein